jgi:cytochrome-b5 reductase
LKGNDGT